MSDAAATIATLKAEVDALKKKLFDVRVQIRRRERAIQALEGVRVTAREPGKPDEEEHDR